MSEKSSSHDELALGPTLQITRPPEAHMPMQGFTLTAVVGPDSGQQFSPKGAAELVIGTHESTTLTLKDPTVSRFHCEIAVRSGGVLIKDTGSRNGVVVDRVRITEAWLHSGALITLGNTTLRFDLATEPVNVPISTRDQFGIMVGRSMAMRRAFSVLERAAASNATVLLGGETGTGKEAAAESIHRESARADGPLVVIDCGAIPGNLLESELFGHEKGAFTGADRQRTGAFEEANGGTLFLDEIGELDVDLQPKLLRALERREIKRVGSTKYMPVDVRIVAATNRNLRAEVNAKTFRSDLYYRLAVVEVALPPLRDRADDLPPLVESILQRLGSTPKEAELVRSREFQAALVRHAWPGNVRELRNYIERCLALAEQAPFDPAEEPPPNNEDGRPNIDTSISLKKARDMWTAVFEKAYLEKILAENNGNVTAAAKAAGVDRIHFYRLLWRNGLK